jgi:cytochrome c oxidase assembly protein subunit 11
MTGTVATGHRRTVSRLLLVTVAMFGFGFAMVPLYDVLCDLTGLNGKTAAGPVTLTNAAVDESRLVTVEFVALMNADSQWEFRPNRGRMKVHPGESYQVTFFARNMGDSQRVAQAVPSVAPGLAAKHFKKTECFCFTQQKFLAGEGRDMPVVFMLDPELPRSINTVTLSYTFFELENQASAAAGGSADTNRVTKTRGEGV